MNDKYCNEVKRAAETQIDKRQRAIQIAQENLMMAQNKKNSFITTVARNQLNESDLIKQPRPYTTNWLR